MKIDIKDLEIFTEDLKRLIAEMPGEADDIIRDATQNMEGYVKDTTGQVTTKITGNLLKDIKSDVKRTGDTVEGSVRSAARHAHLVEYGTGPRKHASGKGVGSMPELKPVRDAFDTNKKAVADDAESKVFRLVKARVRGR